MTPTTVGALLDARAAADPDRPAVIFPGATCTYAELAERSRALAGGLLALGAGPGDVVGILTAGEPWTVVAVLAAARIGAPSLPVNHRFRAAELRHVITDGDVRVLLTTAAFVPELRAALPSLPADPVGRVRAPEAPALRRVVVVDGTGPVGDGADLSGTLTGEDELCLVYTSGTTSRPRGCLHTHAGFLAQGRDMAAALRLTADDRFWTPLPFFHVGGYDVLLATLSAGATMVHPGLFSPDVALEQLAGHRCTVAFPAFETIWLPVLAHPRFAATDLSSLRAVVNVGTPERMRAMQAALPHAVQISCTGSTEAAGFCCIGSLDDPPELRARTAGRANPGMRARVVDPDTGRPVPDGTPGEFVFRGTYRFRRYHRDPELTAARIDADGWFHSGDRMVRDADGRFSFLGRLGDMLKVGGENVSPAEVEDHIAGHPSVAMVQVVAAPDARYGEVPAAFVLPRPGARVDAEEIVRHCLGAIATYKVPRYVLAVDEWPMSGTKIQKYVLRRRIADHLAERGITEAPRLHAPRRPNP